MLPLSPRSEARPWSDLHDRNWMGDPAPQASRTSRCPVDSKRERLYRSFIEEASRVYADALVSDKSEISATGQSVCAHRANEDSVQRSSGTAAERAGRLIIETTCPKTANLRSAEFMEEMDPCVASAKPGRRELHSIPSTEVPSMPRRIPQAGSLCIRERIVQAAIDCTAKSGSETTVADIARGASMSPPRLRFFASQAGDRRGGRADLFEHVFRGPTACGSLERLGSGASNAALSASRSWHEHRWKNDSKLHELVRCGGTRELGSSAILRRPDPGLVAHDHCCGQASGSCDRESPMAMTCCLLEAWTDISIRRGSTRLPFGPRLTR